MNNDHSGTMVAVWEACFETALQRSPEDSIVVLQTEHKIGSPAAIEYCP